MKNYLISLLGLFAITSMYGLALPGSSPDNQVLCICDNSFYCGIYINPDSKNTAHLSLDQEDTAFPMPPRDDCSALQSDWISSKLVRIVTEQHPASSFSNVYYVNPSVPFILTVIDEFLYSSDPTISVSMSKDSKGDVIFNVVNYSLENGQTQVIQPEPNHLEKSIHIQQATLANNHGTLMLNIDFYNDQSQLQHLSVPIDMAKINQRLNAVNILNLSRSPEALDNQESYAYTTTGEAHDIGRYGWHISGFSMENAQWASQSIDCGSPCRGDEFVHFNPFTFSSFENDNDSNLVHNVILYDAFEKQENAEVVSRIMDPTKAVVVLLPNTEKTYGATGVFGSGENGFSDVIDDEGVHITYTDDNNQTHHVFVSYDQIDQAHYHPNP